MIKPPAVTATILQLHMIRFNFHLPNNSRYILQMRTLAASMVSCLWGTPSNLPTIRISMHESRRCTEELLKQIK